MRATTAGSPVAPRRVQDGTDDVELGNAEGTRLETHADLETVFFLSLAAQTAALRVIARLHVPAATAHLAAGASGNRPREAARPFEMLIDRAAVFRSGSIGNLDDP